MSPSLVARRLNAAGAPGGKPIDLRLPGRQVNFSGGGSLVVAARGAADLAVAAVIDDPKDGHSAGYTRAVSNGEVFGRPICCNISLFAPSKPTLSQTSPLCAKQPDFPVDKVVLAWISLIWPG
jgi:hypothetical protein